jgi:hypothetical protein
VPAFPNSSKQLYRVSIQNRFVNRFVFAKQGMLEVVERGIFVEQRNPTAESESRKKKGGLSRKNKNKCLFWGSEPSATDV